MTITSFTIIFLLLLVSQVVAKFYLSSRQIRAVSQHQSQVPAEFAHRISLESHQRAAKYTIARQHLHLITIMVDVVALLVFTLFGGLNWLNNLLSNHISSAIWYQITLLLSVMGISSLIELPFSLYRTFKLEAAFGFNRITPKLFVIDFIKGTLVSLLIMVPLLYALFTFLEYFYSPTWWVWVWAGFTLFTLFLMFIGPKFIMPLFNKFTPLDNPELQERIQALAKRANFGLKALFVMDGSKRSSHGNAFFTGFGKNRRIVFFDTLLEKLNPAEIEAVLAHELGHFKHKHIIKRMLTSFIISFVFLGILAYLIDKPWFYAGLGVYPDPFQTPFGMALVLFFLVLPVFTFWYSPVSSFLSRKDEFEADHFAATQSNADDLISALVKLYDDNAATLTPDALYSAFYDSHPPASIRIQHLKMAS